MDTTAQVATSGRRIVWVVLPMVLLVVTLVAFLVARYGAPNPMIGPAPARVAPSGHPPPSWPGAAPLHPDAATDAAQDGMPCIATDGRGVWVAIWEVGGAQAGGTRWFETDLMTARSADDGATWSAPSLLHPSMGDDEGFDRGVALAADGGGVWVAAWLSDDSFGDTIGDDWDVLFTRSDDDGRTWSAPAALDRRAPDDRAVEEPPGVFAVGGGRWMAQWRRVEPASGEDFTPNRTISEDGGRTWGEPFEVEPYEDPELLGQVWSATVLIARNGRGLACGTIRGGEAAGYRPGVYVSLTADDGTTWTPPRLLAPVPEAGEAAGARVTCVATDEMGCWMVAWAPGLAGRDAGGARPVLVAASADDGATWSRPRSVLPPERTRGETILPAMAGDGAGGWMAAWSAVNRASGGAPAADSDIFVVRFAWP